MIIFKGLSVVKSCLRPESAPLIHTHTRLKKNTVCSFLSTRKMNVMHMHCLDIKCSPGHHHNAFMATGAFGNTQLYCYMLLAFNNSNNSFHWSNENNKYGSETWWDLSTLCVSLNSTLDSRIPSSFFCYKYSYTTTS